MSRSKRSCVSQKVRIIGVGNPDRADDGVGCLVARKLVGRLPPDVSIRTHGGDALTLIDEMRGIDALICIDASVARGSPGRVRLLDLANDRLGSAVTFVSAHSLGLAEAIALAQALGIASRTIFVYAIEGASFELGRPLSAEVDAAAHTVVERVAAQACRLRDDPCKGAGDA
ncbi:hypothetical protein UC34_24690 (plasmid) [Pandoraea vervacti]|uniref:Hydrogenase maturation protease n=1 Tax=Pandoraea vervacti TaxID=656178 RepID=A0ABM5T5A2_9BURK|nr:hydrogenase maturation protease [Pandoraea vervacti]AJP60122.1 hypothetical protein UC34_24690 [Pandoraea vervacti]